MAIINDERREMLLDGVASASPAGTAQRHLLSFLWVNDVSCFKLECNEVAPIASFMSLFKPVLSTKVLFMLVRYHFNQNFNLTDESQLISENLSQQKRRPQAATAGRSRNLSIDINDMEEDDQSTVS